MVKKMKHKWNATSDLRRSTGALIITSSSKKAKKDTIKESTKASHDVASTALISRGLRKNVSFELSIAFLFAISVVKLAFICMIFLPVWIALSFATIGLVTAVSIGLGIASCIEYFEDKKAKNDTINELAKAPHGVASTALISRELDREKVSSVKSADVVEIRKQPYKSFRWQREATLAEPVNQENHSLSRC